MCAATEAHIKRAAAEALIKRCRSLTFALGWRHPFFLIPSQKVSIRVDTAVPTACIDPRGILYLGPQFAGKCDDDELTFVLAHELMHLLMLHFGRRGNRKIRRWNRAADRVLNFALRSFGLKMPKIGLLPQDSNHNDFNTEEMYEVELEQPDDQNPFTLGGQPGPGAGCGPVPSRGGETDEDVPGEGEAPSGGTFPTIDDASREWRQTASQAEALARDAGDTASDVLARVLRSPPSKVKWAQILRGACSRAIAEHGQDDVSWRRRNRRSFAGDFILPGGVTYKAQVACVVDTSGSVGNESLEQAVSEVIAISRAMCVRIYLVTHDAEVHFAGWIEPRIRRSAVEKTLVGRGGTCFQPAYDAIAHVTGRFDHMVHLTDGEPFDDVWPDRPRNARRLVVALIGCKSQHKVPATATVIEAEI